MKTFKTCHQFYLPDVLPETLEQFPRKPGASKTAALRGLIVRRGGPDTDRKCGRPFDRLSREQDPIPQPLDIIAEALGLFIRHQLVLVANQPPFDEEARPLRLERYRAIAEFAARRLPQPDGPLRLAPCGNSYG